MRARASHGWDVWRGMVGMSGEAWPGCMGTGGGRGMETRRSVAKARYGRACVHRRDAAGIRDDGCRRVMGVMSRTSGQATQGGEGKAGCWCGHRERVK